LIELVVSLVVLGVGLTTAAEIVQWSAAEHRVALKKRCALEAAANLLDRLSASDWRSITQQKGSGIHLPDDTVQFLVDPRLSVTVSDKKDGLPAKKISVEIDWAHKPGGKSEEVRLSTWVFERGGKK